MDVQKKLLWTFVIILSLTLYVYIYGSFDVVTLSLMGDKATPCFQKPYGLNWMLIPKVTHIWFHSSQCFALDTMYLKL